MGVVDDIVLGAPWTVSQDLVKSLGIDVVIAGKTDKLSFAEPMPYPYRHAECCIVRLMFVVAVIHKRLVYFKRSIVVAKSPPRPSCIGLWISMRYIPNGTRFGR